MANTVKLKQSAVAGKVPTTSQLALGELAVNTTDGKLFLKKSVSGVESVVDLTAAAAGVSSFNGRTGAVTPTSSDVTGALGFTPIQQGTGTGQLGNTVKIGWTGAMLSLQVDAANFSTTWPINITGSAASANLASTASAANFLNKVADNTWSASSLPQAYSSGVAANFVYPDKGWPNYGTVVMAKTYDGGGSALQLYAPYSAGNGGRALRYRLGNYESAGGNSWTEWRTLVFTESNGETNFEVLTSGLWPIVTRGSNRGVYTRLTNTAGYAAYYATSDGSVVSGWIEISGNTAAYVSSSDYRLKENVRPMTGALERNGRLKPCTYTWKNDGREAEGFIAHELQEVIPSAVSGEKDAVDENGKPKYQGVDTSFVVPHLVACVEELKAINSKQQAQIDAMQAQLDQLTAGK